MPMSDAVSSEGPKITDIQHPSNLKWAHLVYKSVKNVLCSRCSIVNKILAHVIWKSFSFHFIQIKKRPNVSGIRVVCYAKNMKKVQ